MPTVLQNCVCVIKKTPKYLKFFDTCGLQEVDFRGFRLIFAPFVPRVEVFRR